MRTRSPVVAVGGRAQPHRAALVEDHAALAGAQSPRPPHPGVQGVLVEEDVKVGAEGVQAPPDFSEHQLDAAGARRDSLVLRQRDRVRFTGGVRIGAVSNVSAMYWPP